MLHSADPGNTGLAEIVVGACAAASARQPRGRTHDEYPRPSWALDSRARPQDGRDVIECTRRAQDLRIEDAPPLDSFPGDRWHRIPSWLACSAWRASR